VVVAIARRKGPRWYVSLIDGKQAAFDRRGAQLGAAIESLTVPGLEKESFAGKPAHPLDAARLAELETFIEDARVATRTPGAAIAIVQGGKVVYEKGLGVRQHGKPAKVTASTLFMIGSVGKSLTTLMIARLVEQGRLGWDTPVVDVLPSFALGSEATTRAATMRHTACACTGMPRQDLEMIFEGRATAEERIASMKDMKPTTGFGETFQYSNLMVAAGGFAAAHAFAPKLGLGPAYDTAMKQLVFAPLGMKATTFDFKVVARADHAVPHARDLRGEPAPLAITAEQWVAPVRPAGGAWSNVRDMARVLLLELGRGTLGGKRVIGEDVLLARRAPQVKITDDEAYGLGLVVGKQYDVPFVSHTGGTGGFTARFVFLPEHDVGMVIVSNASRAGLFTGSVQRRLFELLFDGKPQARDNVQAALAREAQAQTEELALIDFTPDPAWFTGLAGAWVAPGLGRIELRLDKGKPVLDAGEWIVPVGKKTARDGTVMLIATGGLLPGLEIVPREQAGTTVLVLDAGQHQVVFERAPAGKR
jgi:CubicO group peptidase (beta-lactamase class C family)